MRQQLKRCTQAAHSSSHELIARSALERYTTRSVPADRRTAHAGLPCSLLTPRGAGLSPCTERHSAGPHQAASSRATLAGGTAQAAKLGIFTTAPPAQICDQACSRPTLSVEMMPHVRGAAARRFSTSGFSTESVGRPHAWSQPVRLCAGGAGVVKKIRRRCPLEDRCRVFVSRAASADRCDRTQPHATESHGVTRATVAVARRAGAQRACRVVRLPDALCGAGEPKLICAAG